MFITLRKTAYVFFLLLALQNLPQKHLQSNIYNRFFNIIHQNYTMFRGCIRCTQTFPSSTGAPFLKHKGWRDKTTCYLKLIRVYIITDKSTKSPPYLNVINYSDIVIINHCYGVIVDVSPRMCISWRIINIVASWISPPGPRIETGPAIISKGFSSRMGVKSRALFFAARRQYCLLVIEWVRLSLTFTKLWIFDG